MVLFIGHVTSDRFFKIIFIDFPAPQLNKKSAFTMICRFVAESGIDNWQFSQNVITANHLGVSKFQMHP